MAMTCAIIGLGRIAWMLARDRLRYQPCTHAGTLRYAISAKKQRFELIGICDHDQEKINAFKNWWRLPVEFEFLNYRELILNVRPDLLIIATSLNAHYEIASFAIENRISAILIEKPVCNNLYQAQKLRELVRKFNVLIWINFERRYHPYYRKARDLIYQMNYGKIRHIFGQVLTGYSSRGLESGGPLLHDAVHWIDLLIWFFGKPHQVNSRMILNSDIPEKKLSVSSNNPKRSRSSKSNFFIYPSDRVSFINFHYPDFSAYLEAGGARKYFEFDMQIDFESGRVQVGNRGLQFFKTKKSTRYQNFFDLCEVKNIAKWKNPWIELYSDIYNTLKHKKLNTKNPSKLSLHRPVPGEKFFSDAVSGMDIIDRIYRTGSKL